MRLVPFATAVLTLLLLCPPAATAAALEGQQFDDTIRLANSELVLNGVGVRGVMFIKGYVAALYLPAKAASLRDIPTAGPKRLQLRMMRAAAPENFIDALIGGMRKNSSETELRELDERFSKLTQAIQSNGPARVGDIVNFDYVPETGTSLTVNGKLLGQPISGSDFYAAVLKIFIGDHPVDKKLKRGLRGGAA